jgi:prevent-host-death family protein
MMLVAVRELRNDTASVIDKVRSGELVYLTSNGQRIARIEPVDPYLKPYLTRDEIVDMPKADASLGVDLAAMGTEETDTVGPMEW